MKKYNKPELNIDYVSISENIAAITVSGNAANFENIPQDSWSDWDDLFE